MARIENWPNKLGIALEGVEESIAKVISFLADEGKSGITGEDVERIMQQLHEGRKRLDLVIGAWYSGSNEIDRNLPSGKKG